MLWNTDTLESDKTNIFLDLSSAVCFHILGKVHKNVVCESQLLDNKREMFLNLSGVAVWTHKDSCVQTLCVNN